MPVCLESRRISESADAGLALAPAAPCTPCGTSTPFGSQRSRPKRPPVRPAFQGRLEVLGRAQGLLLRAHENRRVTFDELINTELAAQCIQAEENGLVTLDGPKGIPLRSRTVQSLAMALHELMTNAAKYGALKQPNGHLALRWWQETEAESGKPWLQLDWKESGVAMPPLGAKPHGRGQGRELIERVLPYQFDARTTFAMEADGVHCTISLPASEHKVAAHPGVV